MIDRKIWTTGLPLFEHGHKKMAMRCYRKVTGRACRKQKSISPSWRFGNRRLLQFPAELDRAEKRLCPLPLADLPILPTKAPENVFREKNLAYMPLSL